MHAPHLYKLPIEILGLSSGVQRVLKESKVITVGSLLDQMSGGAAKLLGIPDFTLKAVEEVLDKVIEFQERRNALIQ